MAEFDFNELMFEKCIDGALLAWASLFEEISKENAPRNIDDLPQNINRKDWKKPERNVKKDNKHYYREPVKIKWNYYSWVTWNLKRSIWTENTSYLERSVWVMGWPTEEYAYTQEFWDPARGIPRRSFLNKPLEENQKKIEAQIQKTFNELLDKYQ